MWWFWILEFLFFSTCMIDFGQALEDHGQTIRVHLGLSIFGKDCAKWKLLAIVPALIGVHLLVSYLLSSPLRECWQAITILVFGALNFFNARW